MCNYVNLLFLNLYFTLLVFCILKTFRFIRQFSLTTQILFQNFDMIWIRFDFDFYLIKQKFDLKFLKFFEIWIWNTFYFSWFDQILNNRQIQYTAQFLQVHGQPMKIHVDLAAAAVADSPASMYKNIALNIMIF